MNEKLGRWSEAADGYALAQKVNARAGEELTPRRAAALINAGKAEDARDLLKTLAAAPKADVGVLYLYAVAQRQSDDLIGAEATAKRLRETAPTDPRGMYVLAQILDAKGDAAGAEASLRELLVRDPQDATALNYLGYMFAERGARLDEAVDLVQRALEDRAGQPVVPRQPRLGVLSAGAPRTCRSAADRRRREAANEFGRAGPSRRSAVQAGAVLRGCRGLGTVARGGRRVHRSHRY